MARPPCRCSCLVCGCQPPDEEQPARTAMPVPGHGASPARNAPPIAMTTTNTTRVAAARTTASMVLELATKPPSGRTASQPSTSRGIRCPLSTRRSSRSRGRPPGNSADTGSHAKLPGIPPPLPHRSSSHWPDCTPVMDKPRPTHGQRRSQCGSRNGRTAGQLAFFWSGRRDSNPRPPPWQGPWDSPPQCALVHPCRSERHLFPPDRQRTAANGVERTDIGREIGREMSGRGPPLEGGGGPPHRPGRGGGGGGGYSTRCFSL